MQTSSVKVLAFGPDTYVLNVYSTDANCKQTKKLLAPELKEELDLLKQQAQEDEENKESRFFFDETPLVMKTKGSEGFHWILSNASLTLAVNRSSKMALLAQVRLSSEYLWKHQSMGLGAITSHLHVELASIFGEYILLQPSALDLAADVLFLDVQHMQVKECFVTRAQLDGDRPLTLPEDGLLDGPEDIKRRWKRITGLPFGSRKGQVSALLYDKTHEIKFHSKKYWMWDKWEHEAEKQGFCLLPSACVWRTEIRFKRQALNEMKQEGVFHGIDLAYDIEKHIPALWAYAVGHVGGGEDGLPDGWLRYVIPNENDTSRPRWPVHPDWQVIQGAATPEPLPPSPAEVAEQEQEALLREVDDYLEQHPLLTSKTSPYKREKPSVLPLTDVTKEEAPFDLKPYVRERKRTVNQGQAIAAFVGWAATFEAWQPRPDDAEEELDSLDLSTTLHSIAEQSEIYLQEKQKDFSVMVQKKRVLYSIPKQ